jgi:hypothetical protein
MNFFMGFSSCRSETLMGGSHGFAVTFRFLRAVRPALAAAIKPGIRCCVRRCKLARPRHYVLVCSAAVPLSLHCPHRVVDGLACTVHARGGIDGGHARTSRRSSGFVTDVRGFRFSA